MPNRLILLMGLFISVNTHEPASTSTVVKILKIFENYFREMGSSCHIKAHGKNIIKVRSMTLTPYIEIVK